MANDLTKTKPTWLDFNFLYGLDKDPELVFDINAIAKSIYVLLKTTVRTVPFRRSYGSYLAYYLQQPVSSGTAAEIRASLISTLTRWEPRVRINQQSTTVVPTFDNTGYDVTISYFVPSLQKPGQLRFVASSLE